MVRNPAKPATNPTTKSPKKPVVDPHNSAAPSENARAKREALRSQTAVADKTGKGNAGSVMKVIRDSFTMPVADYELILALKNKCLGLGIAVKKSELLRAGLHALGRISDENLTQVVTAVESVKTGRPPGRKKRKKTHRAKGKKQ